MIMRQKRPMIMIHIHEEAAHCLLCEDAPCTKACKTGDVARAIRAIRFDNEGNAQRFVADCADADLARAEEACVHYDRPIRIREMLASVCRDAVKTDHVKPSLAISFCGIPCENPFFLASSAVCTNYDMVARAFDAGWAGVFYKTICKQDIREVSPRFDAVKSDTRFAGFRNMEQLSENPYVMDFDILRRLKQDYPTKVVVASVMGQFEEEWAELAQMAEAAGCDAVELNFSCPQMRLAGMGSDVGQNPELVTFYTAYVKRAVHIPVIVKMTPNITRITEPAMGAYFAGADAISAINTIKSVTMSHNAEVSGRHRRHRDLARRIRVHTTRLPQCAGVYRRHGVRLPHHRRPHARPADLYAGTRHRTARRPRGLGDEELRAALRPRPRHHRLSEG